MEHLSEPAFLSQVQAFAKDVITPAAAGWSLGETPAPAIFDQAASLGLTGLELPVAQGGRGAGFALKCLACAALAAADFGFAMSAINSHNVALRLSLSAPAALRDAHLPGILSGRVSACTALTEPGAGSDFAAIRTTARKQGQGWVLNGEKTWIVNGRHAGLAIVFAQCAEIGDARGIGGFLVDLTRPGVTRHAIDSGFAQTSMGTGGFTLHAVAVPDDALLLPPGSAFKTILGEINGARTYVAAMCNAMLRTALDDVLIYGAQRNSFGKPLIDHDSWRAPLDAADIALTASVAVTETAIRQIQTGQDAQLAAARAKIGAVETCQQHLPALLHAMGAEGLRPTRCFTRHLAAAQIAGLTDGATGLLRDRVARLTRTQPRQKEE